MSAQGVFTRDLRVRFVEKSSGEVGDGTLWPMLATLDQIAELWYRVKDCKFISGSAYQATGDPLIAPAAGFAIHHPSTQSSNRAYALVNYDYVTRGYTTAVEDGTATISAHNSQYLADEYDRGDTTMWRDVSDNERGEWLEGTVAGDILPYWNEKEGLAPPKNAFSYESNMDTPVDDQNFFTAGLTFWGGFYPFTSFTPLSIEASVVFSGEVAVVKADPANDIFAPTNSFYIGVKLYAYADPGTSDLSISTDLADFSGAPQEVCKYKIRLAGDVDIECPIYFEVWPVASGSGYSYLSGIDFIHKATEWWPYVKDNPATPVWYSGTGVKC